MGMKERDAMSVITLAHMWRKQKHKHTSNRDTSARAAVWIWNVRWYRMIGCEIHTQTHTHWMLKNYDAEFQQVRHFNYIFDFTAICYGYVWANIISNFAWTERDLIEFHFIYFYLSNISRCQFECSIQFNFDGVVVFFFHPVEVRWFFTYIVCNTPLCGFMTNMSFWGIFPAESYKMINL